MTRHRLCSVNVDFMHSLTSRKPYSDEDKPVSCHRPSKAPAAAAGRGDLDDSDLTANWDD